MTNPILGVLADEIAQTRTAIRSAVVLIDGIRARIDAAVAAAVQNGATEAELQPLVELEQALESDRQELARAVEQNP